MIQPRPEPLRSFNERHRDIAEALEMIFLEEGFRDVTVGELAARLKCSKRTLYELAPSKQELFVLIVERWLDRIRHLGWAGALEYDDPQQRIIAYLEPGVSQSRLASRRFLQDLQSFRPAYMLLEAHQRERTGVLRDIVEDGIKRGRFRKLHAPLVAEVFLAAVGRMNEPDFLENAGISYSNAFSEVYDLFLKGLISPD